MIQPFTQLTSRVIPLPQRDVDTDQIIPARYLKVTDKAGLSEGLFAGWRYLPDGSPNPDFPLNRAEYQEHRFCWRAITSAVVHRASCAPVLAGWGVRAVISTSFADIFRNNALKNGLLPVAVDAETQRQLFSLAAESSESQFTIDLAEQTLTLPDGRKVTFPLDAFNKTCLLEGIDQLGYLLKYTTEIEAYEQQLSKR
jgi:3-isopropylmalate/(R)-2-methylmalate dehydratase small subunit